MISRMCFCGLSVSYFWCYGVVFHLYGLHSILKIGILNNIIVLLLLIALMLLIQVPLLTLG